MPPVIPQQNKYSELNSEKSQFLSLKSFDTSKFIFSSPNNSYSKSPFIVILKNLHLKVFSLLAFLQKIFILLLLESYKPKEEMLL